MAKRNTKSAKLPANVIPFVAIRKSAKAEQNNAPQQSDARTLLDMRKLSRQFANSGLRDSAMEVLDALTAEYFFERGGRL